MELHFIDVGLGNMTLLRFPNGTTWLYDCNITEDNEDTVFRYVKKAMNGRTRFQAFVCSHRDADHMRGVTKVHNKYPIGEIWDADVPGTTTDSPEYREYMDLRRELGSKVIKPRTCQDVGGVTVRWMNGKDDGLSGANDQSIVVKIEYGGSALLAADTTYVPWRDKILPKYTDAKLSADILLGAHHGSDTFFNDPPSNEYEAHMRKIKPAMTLLSVGPNNHGLPDSNAIRLYNKHSRGSNKGNKLYRTDQQRNMKLTLKKAGGWDLKTGQ